MNEKTLTALNGSIAHWRRISAGKEGEQGETNCPLCQVFSLEFSCTTCPVAEVGCGGCYGTPYIKWVEHHRQNHRANIYGLPGRIVRCDTCKEIAMEEVRFLRSLLPKTKKGRK
jgi:hypothetical protein